MGRKEKQTSHYVECGGLTAIKDQQTQMCDYSENKQIKRYCLDEKITYKSRWQHFSVRMNSGDMLCCLKNLYIYFSEQILNF